MVYPRSIYGVSLFVYMQRRPVKRRSSRRSNRLKDRDPAGGLFSSGVFLVVCLVCRQNNPGKQPDST